MIDRIHERAVFRQFGRDASRARSGPLTVVRASRPGGTRPAVAYAISRSVGSAVVRNRLRRQLRAACARMAGTGELEPGAYLIVVRPEAAGADMTTLSDALSGALERLSRSGSESNSSARIASSDRRSPSERSDR